MRLGARRTESLHWKKHTLLFHCSGALEEHGSSSSGLNKDANFIPSSAVNIKKDMGLVGGQWLGYSVSSLVFVPVTLVLAGIAGSDPFFAGCWRCRAVTVPYRLRGGLGTDITHKQPGMGSFTSLERKGSSPSFFNEIEWKGKKDKNQYIMSCLLPVVSQLPDYDTNLHAHTGFF